MLPGINLGMGLENGSVRADYVSDALGASRSGTLAGAVGKTNLALTIAQQWVGKVEFLRKGRILPHRIGADTQDLDIFCFVVMDSITESFSLGRSATRIGLWIEPEHYGLAAVVT